MRANQLFLKVNQVDIRADGPHSWKVDEAFPFVTVDWNDEGTLTVTFKGAEDV